jgi:hypothetical protein
VVDVGSNPNTFFLPVPGNLGAKISSDAAFDFRTPRGTDHTGLLNEKSIIESLRGRYGFRF